MTLTRERTLAELVRDDFPILHQEINGHPLIYFDNAASSQKPRAVLEALRRYYECDNANVHRGAHTLSARATDAFEAARAKVAAFVGAQSDREIVFTRNASEAINLVAYSWGMANLQAGDEILLTVMEHHSNIVPWQLVAQRTGAAIRYIEPTATGEFDLDAYADLLKSDRVKLVSVAHVSNTLGCITPVAQIARMARDRGAKVLIDACQSVPHMPVNVREIGCDWLVASGHKMCAPTGIGFLYGKLDVLRQMPPFLGGGEMIAEVFLERSTYAEPPHRFEAGTPAIGEAIALGAAVDYLTGLGMDRIHAYEVELVTYLRDRLQPLVGTEIRTLGPLAERAGLISFAPIAPGIHANDIAELLDREGIAIRSGHHCTQPLHRHLGISGSARASVYFYNTFAEVDRFVAVLQDTLAFFQGLL